MYLTISNTKHNTVCNSLLSNLKINLIRLTKCLVENQKENKQTSMTMGWDGAEMIAF